MKDSYRQCSNRTADGSFFNSDRTFQNPISQQDRSEG